MIRCRAAVLIVASLWAAQSGRFAMDMGVDVMFATMQVIAFANAVSVLAAGMLNSRIVVIGHKAVSTKDPVRMVEECGLVDHQSS